MKNLYILTFLLIILTNSWAQDTTNYVNLLGTEVLIQEDFIPKNTSRVQNFRIFEREISFQNAANSADMLQQTGRVLVQKSQAGGGSPILRGMEANKILLVVDGVRMNNAIFRGGHLQNVLRVDANILERTDVIFGSSSSLYGSDALGGTLHFHTRKAEYGNLPENERTQLTGNYKIRGGTATQEFMQHADVNFRFKKWGSLTSFTFSSFGEMRQGRAKNPFNKKYPDQFNCKFYVAPFNGKDSMVINLYPEIQKRTAYKQYNLYQNFVFQQNEHITHEVSFHGTTTSEVARYDRLTETKNNLPINSEWYYGPEKWVMGRYRLQGKWEDKFIHQIAFTTAIQHFEESRISRRWNNSNRRHQIERVNVQSANLEATKFWNQHKFILGGEAFWNQVYSSAFSENIFTSENSAWNTRYPDGGSTMSAVSAYLADVVQIGEKFVLDAGFRYTFNGLKANLQDTVFFSFPYSKIQQNSNAASGHLGLTYHPSANSQFALVGTTGYRVPNVDDVAKVFESTAGRLIVPNANLKPEYTYNVELHYRQKLTQDLNLELTGYHTWLRNLIAVNKSTFEGADSILYNGTKSGIFMAQNQNKARITGFFAGLNGKIAENWRVFANVNYTVGKVATDTTPIPLDHIAPLYGSIGLRYESAKTNIELSSLWNGEKKLADYSPSGEDNLQYATPEGMPAWFTLNLRSQFQVYKGIQAQIGIENLLDTQYRVFASGISSMGRNFYAALATKF